jgi:hypothetical protein
VGRPKVFDTEKIREDFINGHSSLRALAGKYRVSYSHVSKLASRDGWTARRKEKRLEIAKAAAGRRANDGGLAGATLSATEHVGRSLGTGERIHQLLSDATAGVGAGDTRTLKTLVDAWANWDNQMRKNHRLDDEAAISAPVVNIALLSTLPDG